MLNKVCFGAMADLRACVEHRHRRKRCLTEKSNACEWSCWASGSRFSRNMKGLIHDHLIWETTHRHTAAFAAKRKVKLMDGSWGNIYMCSECVKVARDILWGAPSERS